MSAIAKTIQIFLPHGDPRGIRFAEITTRIVQVIEVPRVLLEAFLAMPESDQVAVYFLLGGTEDGIRQKVYIGQTGDLRARLAKHNKDKDFWERALVLISRTDSMTQTHALFLEWHCLQASRQADRYADENGNAGSKPHTPAPLAADCFEIYETGRVLLATLGHPIFEPVARGTSSGAPADLFFCTAPGVSGKGQYTEEGFVVLRGSRGRRETLASLGEHSYALIRDELLKSGVIREDGDAIVFEKDHLFKKPSPAAVVLLGRPANGWDVWKSASGKTLNELKRHD